MDKYTSYGSVIEGFSEHDIESVDLISPTKSQQPSSSWTSKLPAIGAVLTISFVGVFMTSTKSFSVVTNFIAHLPKPTTLTDNLESFTFTLARDGYEPLGYFSDDSKSYLKYSILSDMAAVIEPYANMRLVIPTVDTSSSDFYHYKLCPSGKSVSLCSRGMLNPSNSDTDVMVNIECKPYDTYNIVVHKYTSTNDLIGEASGTATCMYIRREIRSLTDTDLSKTMDAMFALYKYSDSEGKTLFGENFQSSNYLLQIHYFNAAWQDGDHIHEGNVFLPQHIKLTNIFETAMQAVDPSVSLPYWDFTIESATDTQIWESPIFSEKMFGSLNRAKDDYWGWTWKKDSIASAAIPDGRWANLKADKNTMFSDLNYAYGFLRAPWSMNPSPYLSRFTSNNKAVPTCSSHYDLLNYDRQTDFFYMIPYAAHAPTHGSIGGVYGCDMFDELREAGYLIDEDAQVNLCKNWVFYMKEFFRSNYIMPNKGCSPTSDTLTEDSMSCGFTCDSTRTKDFVFALKNILNSDNTCVPTNMEPEGWLAWNDFICNGNGYKIFGGDHLESASAADPSFWPIHPTLERLLHAKYLAGGFLTTHWPTDSAAEYVCDKASCYDEEKGFGFWEGCCYGHYLSDQYLDPASGKRDVYTGLTNQEVMTATDPTSSEYSMTYLYDKFDWSHCEAKGQNFGEKLETLNTLARSRKSMSEDEINLLLNAEPKIQASTGGLKDKANDKVGTNMYSPSIGVVDAGISQAMAQQSETGRTSSDKGPNGFVPK